MSAADLATEAGLRFFRAADQRFRSPNAVVALSIAAALIVLGASVALLTYTQAAVDQISEVREARLMRFALADNLSDIKEDVVANGMWTDAYVHATQNPDPAWLHPNFGENLYLVRNHQVTIILDGRDRPIYVSLDGKVAPNDAGDRFLAAARPLIAATRADADAKLARAPAALGMARQGAVSAAVRSGTQVYLTAAATIVPEPSYGPLRTSEPPPILLTARTVDGKLLSALREDFGLAEPRLVLGPAPQASTPLPGVDGRPVAAVAWRPEAPGRGVLRQARWEILVIGLAVVLGVVVIVMRLRRLARAVVRARDRALAADHAKTEFIANMSHEIRTPLNGVLGMAQVMEGHELTADQRERLKVIRESGATLLMLLNDVLDLSKIEAGRLEITAATFRLDDLVQRVTATFEGLAAAKDLTLTARISPEAHGAWMGDALRIRQVLSNLVSNAVKFTDAGEVSLEAAVHAGGLRFVVRDTGIGLDPETIPHLFEKFSQADASTTRRYGGTGLGLAIVQALVELMGGTVDVASRPGQGATFTVWLPLARARSGVSETAAAEIAVAPSQALRVLAAEDNPINQYVLRALMEPLEAELTLVANGREAVEAFRRGAFDVVLMDVQMPEMNGLDATRAIRDLEAQAERPPTPILALTANVMSHQLETYVAAGMDGHIPKPLDAAALYAALEAALRPAGHAAAA